MVLVLQGEYRMQGTIEQPVRKCQSRLRGDFPRSLTGLFEALDLSGLHSQVLQEIEVSGWRKFQIRKTAVVHAGGLEVPKADVG